MYKSTFISEINNYFSLNSEKPCMESCIQGNVCDIRYLVDNEKEEVKQPLLQEENEGSFSLKNLLLLAVGAVTVIGGIVLYETRKNRRSMKLTVTMI
jgi:hypothetical protein